MSEVEEVNLKAVNNFWLVENTLNGFTLGNMSPVMIMTFLYKLGNDLVNAYMTNPAVLNFLKEDEKFDVCIIEIFNADALLVSTIKFQGRLCKNVYCF